MANAESNAQAVVEILNRLEGHPNFVKANRILDVLHDRARDVANRKLITRKRPVGATGLHLAAHTA
jgi:hypothetical protein